MERAMIVATLERFGGHRGQAAAALGIGVRTLSGKLRAYGFAPRARDFGSTDGQINRQMLPLASAESAADAVRKSA